MNNSWFEFLPPFHVFFAGLSMVFLTVWITRARGSWLMPLSVLYCISMAADFLISYHLELSNWHAEVFVARVLEIPLVLLLASLCIFQAGRLPAGRSGTRRVLSFAPAALVAGWLLALVGQMVWPEPIFGNPPDITPATFFVFFPASLPMLFYLALVGWLLAVGATNNTENTRLRVRDFSLVAATLSYLLLQVNGTVRLAAISFLPDEPLQRVLMVQLDVQNLSMFSAALGLLSAFLLTVVPPRADTLSSGAYTDVLKARDRFEARRWQLTAAQKLRRPTRALHYAGETAKLLELPESDRRKTVETIELVAALAYSPTDNPGPEDGEVTPEKVRELLDLYRRFETEDCPSDLSKSVETFCPDESLWAALSLCRSDLLPDHRPEITASCWYHLAAIACQDNSALSLPKDLTELQPSPYCSIFDTYHNVKQTSRETSLDI